MRNKKANSSNMNSNNKILDISKNLVDYSRWNGLLLFWGVETPNYRSGGEYQPFKWYLLRLMCRGDGSVCNRPLAKDYRNCFFYSSFSNSLTSNEGVYLNRVNSLFAGQKQLVWAVVYYCSSLLLFNQTLKRES